ncbi:MAG: tRNA pseudouridine32 synthase/23S rRNA pseudouridine746 synthase [Hyphomicrobiaceae bacterium]|jgi:tRNA pseudouridine32 synthase/23S rRNA pseudouridine746 synthase
MGVPLLLTALDDLDLGELVHAPFPNPFDQLGLAPVGRTAAERVRAEFTDGWVAEGVPVGTLETAGGGKMFGVLVVATADGKLGFLKAFSGMFDGSWELPGFVPPLFDLKEREELETVGEANVTNLTKRAQAAARSIELIEARQALAILDERLAADKAELRAVHSEKRRLRRERRRELSELSGSSGSHQESHAATIEQLAVESRTDKTARRELEKFHALERAEFLAAVVKMEREVAALDRLRRFVSRRLMRQLHDTYRIPNARGESIRMRELFADRAPPSGAADCAAPKLLAYAYRNGLRPLALAEFWWGPPPPTGGRLSGVYYPACRGKCGPLLPYMLEGLDVSSVDFFVPPASDHLDINIVYEDERIVVIDKPSGLLSVPSSNPEILDSATARLHNRYPGLQGQLFVHRLDMDTSGLLVAALDARAHAMLQRQFAKRTVGKRYIAVVDGEIGEDEGLIDLALALDFNDRPRHIHDPIDGKSAVTRWRVIERAHGRTRLELLPLTGRTHQLRVHAAHPLGLASPIVGDPLYGRGGGRLMLHAAMIHLRHPSTNEFVTFESPVPF